MWIYNCTEKYLEPNSSGDTKQVKIDSTRLKSLGRCFNPDDSPLRISEIIFREQLLFLKGDEK